MILAIETFHCLSDVDRVMQGCQKLLKDENSYLIIADVFNNKDIMALEGQLADQFIIERRSNITRNVKNAMNLDRQRHLDIVSEITCNNTAQ